MRGLGAGYTQILINGERAPPGFSLDTLSPDLIERIEVYRGAVAEFSTQAIAGTINIVLRMKPSQRQRELKLTASEENAQAAGNVTVQVGDKLGALSYTVPLIVNRFAFKGAPVSEQLATDPAGVPLQRYVTEQFNSGHGVSVNTSPRVNYDFSKDHTLAWDGFVNFGRFQGQFDEHSTTFLGAPPPYVTTLNAFKADNVNARTNLRWTRKLADDARIEAQVGFIYNDRDSKATLDSFDAAGAFVLHRVVEGHASDNGATTKGKYLLPLIASHAIALGWDGSGARRRESRVQEDTVPAGFPEFDINESYDVKVNRLALFAQDEWDVTPRFSLYTGLRWEGIWTKSVGNVIQDVTSRSGVASPIVQVLWKLPGTEKDQLRAGLARTYKAPNTFDLIPRRFISNNNTATTPDFEGNPNLKPELAWGLDLAYEHYFTGGGVASLSGFARRIDDLILRELINRNGTWITRPANVGAARVAGIEVDLKTSLKTFWANGPATDLRANFGRNWSQVDFLPGPDNRLNEQTRFSANLGFDHRFTAPPLAVGGNYAFKTGGPVRVTLTQTNDSSARRSLDLYAVWRFSPTVQLRVTATNLLAQDFQNAVRVTDVFGTLQYSTLNPTYRRIGATLEMKL
jgi:outer membrane receptor for ferrienterochelin and colicin